MPNNDALKPLQRTSECLNKIKENLTPFLELLDRYHNQQSNGNGSGASNVNGKKKEAIKFNKQEITEAEAAVALAMGTLRYMAHRLKGNARGQKKNDPLRLELDKMRKTLVAVKKLRRDDSKKDDTKKAKSTSTDATAVTGSGVKRRRLAEEETSSASTSSSGNDSKNKAPEKKKAKK